MAKKSKIIEIDQTPFYRSIAYNDPKNSISSDTTFKFTTTEKTYVNFQPVNSDDITHDSYYIKDGNDLKFVTVYYDEKTYAVKKKLTMTILDYDAHYNKYTDAVYNDGSAIDPSKFYNQMTDNKARVGNTDYVAGTDKADKYVFSSGNGHSIDFKGNDYYTFASEYQEGTYGLVHDYAGNDKYSISVLPEMNVEGVGTIAGETVARIYDYAGNDTYTLKDARKEPDEGGIDATITDYNGNDKYNVNGANTVTINESNKGKDTYNITNTVEAKVYDWGGNDTYNVANSKIEIRENMSSGSFSDVKGTSGNETYNLNAMLAGSKVYDMLGNDKYNINYAQGEEAGAKKIFVTDSDGKDNYKITASKNINLTDQGGNDTYNIIDSDKLNITDGTSSEDKPENETYTLKTVSNSELTDKFGNDSYKIDLSLNTTINNWSGADKYTVTNSNRITIEDNAYKNGSGNVLAQSYDDKNDTFTVKDSIETTIYSGKGDDKFTVSDDAMRTAIVDVEGNENYEIKDSALVKITDQKGNDTYKLTDVDNWDVPVAHYDTEGGALDYNIQDKGGSDKYDIKDSRFIYVLDNAKEENEKNTFNVTSTHWAKIITGENDTVYSEDTYNLASSKTVYVDDYGTSNDTYNITKSTAKSNINITDKAGNDTYNITKSVAKSEVKLTDESGNDTYNIDKLVGEVTITDKNGDDDILNIKSGKSGDIIFMANAEHDGGSVFAYDKKNGGFVKMERFYDYKSEAPGGGYDDPVYEFTVDDIGKIETIKAGKTTLTVTSIDTLNSIEADVSAFLTTGAGKAYGTIEATLNSGDSDVINGLIACFNTQG